MINSDRKTARFALDEHGLDRAAALLRRGCLVAFPTETVYGLGADATNEKAVASVYEAKGRPTFNPLIVHMSDRAMVSRYVDLSDRAVSLADRFWPGPLTLVCPRKAGSKLSELVSAGLPTVAVRIPAHGAARDLIRLADRPIAAPSANASGRLSPTEADHVLSSLDGRIDAILDGGACTVGLESTVIDVSDTEPMLLRAGGLPSEALEAALSQSIQSATEATDDTAAKSPGMLLKHYAPGLPLRLNATTANAGEALIGFGPVAGDDTLSASGDLVEAASRLFRLLHRFDDPSRFSGIAVAPVPESGLGVAINDRLRRAERG